MQITRINLLIVIGFIEFFCWYDVIKIRYLFSKKITECFTGPLIGNVEEPSGEVHNPKLMRVAIITSLKT